MIFRTATLTEQFDLNTVCRGDGFLFVRDGVGVAGRDAIQSVTEAEAMTFLHSLTPSRLSDSSHADNSSLCTGSFLTHRTRRVHIAQNCFSKN